ncbi:MAG: methionine biosynthesis protein MetW [Candidatus Omnitrophica bacterium]|nr:methionine biosynthesis protein MetW [Candidatus Omnitrophota bacterium]
MIARIVEPNSKVLDLGCGDGALLFLLEQEKGAQVQGIDLNEDAIYKCVEKGLSVFHGDIDSGLIEYPDQAFDYVILNQSMQEAKLVTYVIQEALRVGKKAIVGFPNFAYISARVRLFFQGKTPMTKSLPYRWHDTPNLHFLSISDFKEFCAQQNIAVLEEHYINQTREIRFWPNLFALNAIFLIAKS